MKIKDFNRAKEILEEIKRCQERLSNLALPNASVVRLEDSKGYTSLTIGVLPGCEHEDAEDAMKFVQKLKDKYTGKIDRLHQEFEAL